MTKDMFGANDYLYTCICKCFGNINGKYFLYQ